MGLSGSQELPAVSFILLQIIFVILNGGLCVFRTVLLDVSFEIRTHFFPLVFGGASEGENLLVSEQI